MKKRYILNILLVMAIGLGVMAYLIGTQNPEQLLGNLEQLAPKWIIGGFLCIGLYWAFETLIQQLLLHKMFKGNPIWNSFKVVMTGHFFNAITPFATGGQPMQAYLMTKQGLPAGTSVSVLMVKFIIYQIVLTVYSLIVLIIQLPFFYVKVSGLIYVSVIGFGVNLLVVALLLCTAFMKEGLKRIGFFIINVCFKIKLVKKPMLLKRKLICQVDLFNENIQILKNNSGLLVKVSVLTIFQLTAYFLIPYMVYRAFGFESSTMFVIISAAAFIVMFSSFVPIPGGSGVAEGSFFLLFKIFFPESILPLAILCWRIITFYVPLCCGGVMMGLPNQQLKKVKKSHIVSA